MIRSGGEKVSPTEIENVLYRLEGVELAAVIGVPHPLLGMVAKAVIVPKDCAQLTANRVLQHCARHLEDIMIPRTIEFRTAMPRNEAGKIDKLQLRGRDEN